MRWNKSRFACCAAAVLLVWAPPVASVAPRQGAGVAPAQTSPAPSTTPLPDASAGAEPRKPATEPFVVIDPSHGGDDKGAVFTSRIVEKEVTLAFARELRKEFQERGVPVRLVRDSDASVALDRRAEVANQPHAAIYIALHAGTPGQGVRVYSPLLVSEQPSSGIFLAWENAQSGSLARSRTIAQAVARELQKKNIHALALASPLRPLNNVVPPAIAVELASTSGDPYSLQSQRLQNNVSSAIASAVTQSRSQWAGGRQ